MKYRGSKTEAQSVGTGNVFTVVLCMTEPRNVCEAVIGDRIWLSNVAKNAMIKTIANCVREPDNKVRPSQF